MKYQEKEHNMLLYNPYCYIFICFIYDVYDLILNHKNAITTTQTNHAHLKGLSMPLCVVLQFNNRKCYKQWCALQ